MKKKPKRLRRILSALTASALLLCFANDSILFYGKASEYIDLPNTTEVGDNVSFPPSIDLTPTPDTAADPAQDSPPLGDPPATDSSVDAPGGSGPESKPPTAATDPDPAATGEPDAKEDAEDSTASEIPVENDSPKREEPAQTTDSDASSEIPGLELTPAPIQRHGLQRAGGPGGDRTVTMDFEPLSFGTQNALSSKRTVYPLQSARLVVTDGRRDPSLGNWSLRLSASEFHHATQQSQPLSNALYLNGALISDQKQEIFSAPASGSVTSVDLLDQNATGWNSGFEVILNPGQARKGQYVSVLDWELVYAPFVETVIVTASLTSDTSSRVTWTEVEGAEYWIYRSTGDNSHYSLVAAMDTLFPYPDDNLAYDTTYYYRVDAMRDGAVVSSGEAFVTTGTLQPPNAIPVATANGLDTSRIQVKWNVIDGAVGYRVYRNSQPNGSYALVAEVPSTEWVDTGLPPDTGYYYKVKAYNAAGEGLMSDPAYGKTKLNAPVSAPPNVQAKGISSSQIQVTWNGVADATGYYVYRSDAQNGSYVKVADVPSTSWVNSGLPANTGFYYKVEAYNSVGAGPRSAFAYGKTDPIAPASAPVVQANGINSSQIQVTWNSVAGAAGYYVYRSDTQNGTYTRMTTVSSTNWTNSGLPANTGYYYKVEAYNAAGIGPRSNPAYGKTSLTAPASAPPNVQAKGLNTSQIQVTWGSVAGAAGYYVYRSATQSGTYTKMATVAYTNWTNTGLTANTGYYYKVEAYNSAGIGPRSAAAYGKTLAAATTPPSGTTPSTGPTPPTFWLLSDQYNGSNLGNAAQVNLALDPKRASDHSRIALYKSTSANGPYQKFHTYSPNWANITGRPQQYVTRVVYNDINTYPVGTMVYYKIAAINSSGTEGPMSDYLMWKCGYTYAQQGHNKLGSPPANLGVIS